MQRWLAALGNAIEGALSIVSSPPTETHVDGSNLRSLSILFSLDQRYRLHSRDERLDCPHHELNRRPRTHQARRPSLWPRTRPRLSRRQQPLPSPLSERALSQQLLRRLPLPSMGQPALPQNVHDAQTPVQRSALTRVQPVRRRRWCAHVQLSRSLRPGLQFRLQCLSSGVLLPTRPEPASHLDLPPRPNLPTYHALTRSFPSTNSQTPRHRHLLRKVSPPLPCASRLALASLHDDGPVRGLGLGVWIQREQFPRGRRPGWDRTESQ